VRGHTKRFEARGRLVLVGGGGVIRARSLGRISRASVIGDLLVRLGMKSRVAMTGGSTRYRPLYEDRPNHDD
jgi:hypothetical protein